MKHRIRTGKSSEGRIYYKIKCINCGKIDGMSRSDLDLSHLMCGRCKKIGTTKYIRLKKRRRTKI